MSNYAAVAVFRAKWNTVEKTKIYADPVMSLKSLSRKEEKYQMESCNLEPSTRL